MTDDNDFKWEPHDPKNGPFYTHFDKDGNEIPDSEVSSRIGFADPETGEDISALSALRKLYPEIDSAITDAQAEARRSREKHDGMVSALRELQRDLRSSRIEANAFYAGIRVVNRLLKEGVGVIDAIGTAQKGLDDADYWINKIRTDDDYDDAHRQMATARESMDNAIAIALGFARQRKPKAPEGLVEKVEEPKTLRERNGMGPKCNFGSCTACGNWHDRVMTGPKWNPSQAMLDESKAFVEKLLKNRDKKMIEPEPQLIQELANAWKAVSDCSDAADAADVEAMATTGEYIMSDKPPMVEAADNALDAAEKRWHILRDRLYEMADG